MVFVCVDAQPFCNMFKVSETSRNIPFLLTVSGACTIFTDLLTFTWILIICQEGLMRKMKMKEFTKRDGSHIWLRQILRKTLVVARYFSEDNVFTSVQKRFFFEICFGVSGCLLFICICHAEPKVFLA